MEIVVAGISVAFVLVSDPYKSPVLLAAIIMGILVILIELIYVYYSGVDLGSMARVHPESRLEEDAEAENTFKPSKKTVKTMEISKNTYF